MAQNLWFSFSMVFCVRHLTGSQIYQMKVWPLSWLMQASTFGLGMFEGIPMAFIMSIIPSIQMNSGILGELGVILIFWKIFSAVEHFFSQPQSARLPVFLTYPYRVGGGEGGGKGRDKS